MCFASQSLEQTRRVSALGKGGCSPGYSECCSTTLSYCSTLVTAEILSIIRRLKTGSSSISHPPPGHGERRCASEAADPVRAEPPGPRMNGWAGLAPPAAPQTPAAPGGGPGRQHPQHPRNAPPCASPPPSGPQFFSVFTKIYEFARKF